MIIRNDWSPILEEEFRKPYFISLRQFLEKEYNSEAIYPDKQDIFSALDLSSYTNTKVVILGQDPYHGAGQAHGLSFSVKSGVTPPPSLRNVFQELHSDLGCFVPNNGYLVKWAEQGVLLLNNVLTVRDGAANSHKGKGWEIFTDRLITALNDRKQPVVFLLWGNHAGAKGRFIDVDKHRIIYSPHPSPLSAYRGFFGSRPFSQVNQYLAELGSDPIDWQIPNL